MTMEGAAAFIKKVETELDQLYLDLWKEVTPCEPIHLFHYTSIEALGGILSTRKFFLSDMLASTDQSEIRHGIAILRNVLEANKKDDLISRALLETLAMNELWRFGSSFYVHAICFCAGNDVLTQWRGYSPSGGVAIGVDFKELKRRAENMEFGIAKMLYARDKQEEIIRRTLNRSQELLQEASPMGEGVSEMEINQFIAKFLTQIAIRILKSTLLFKHEAFSSEDEWRVLTVEDAESVPGKLRFRVRDNRITPYTEIPFEPSLVSEVRCSPGTWSRSALYGVNRLAKSLGDHVKVTQSELPVVANCFESAS